MSKPGDHLKDQARTFQGTYPQSNAADSRNPPDSEEDKQFEEMLARVEDLSPISTAIPLSLAVLNRLRRLWGIVTGGPYLHIRFPEDETVYQVLRNLLIDRMTLDTRFQEVHALAHSTLPEELPTSDVLIAFDGDIRAYFERDFQRLHTALVQCALKHNFDLELDHVVIAVLMATYDHYLGRIENEAKESNQQLANDHGLMQASAAPDIPEGGNQAGPLGSENRGGRPPKGFSYDLATHIYRALMDGHLDSDGDRIRPVTYRLMRDHYVELTGETISVETIGDRIRGWKAQKLQWPPTAPDHETSEENGKTQVTP